MTFINNIIKLYHMDLSVTKLMIFKAA